MSGWGRDADAPGADGPEARERSPGAADDPSGDSGAPGDPAAGGDPVPGDPVTAGGDPALPVDTPPLGGTAVGGPAPASVESPSVDPAPGDLAVGGPGPASVDSPSVDPAPGDPALGGRGPVETGGWSDDPAPGDDPLPSSGSLRWAPDPTERFEVGPDASNDLPFEPSTGHPDQAHLRPPAGPGATGREPAVAPPHADAPAPPGSPQPGAPVPPRTPHADAPAPPGSPQPDAPAPSGLSQPGGPAPLGSSQPTVDAPPGASPVRPSSADEAIGSPSPPHSAVEPAVAPPSVPGPDAPGEPGDAAPPGRPAAPASPAYAPPAHPTPAPASPPAPRHYRERARRQRRTETIVLGGIGVLVVVVGVAAMAISRDGGGGGEPDGAAATTTALVAGDGSDPAGPVVGPTGVIGSWDGSSWQARPDGDQPGAGLDYAVVGYDDAVGSARGVAVAEDCPSQRSRSELDVAVVLEGGDGRPPPIAVAGVAEPRPRAVQQFDTGSDVYRRAARDVARGLGATSGPNLTQVLRTDLDGNGTEEVVVAAEHLSHADDLTPAAGDWSVVFLRRVVGNGVATDVLASSTVGANGGRGGSDARIERIRVAAIADLNGDGVMEIALHGRSAGGQWTSVHAVGGDGTPSEVLKAGCDG